MQKKLFILIPSLLISGLIFVSLRSNPQEDSSSHENRSEKIAAKSQISTTSPASSSESESEKESGSHLLSLWNAGDYQQASVAFASWLGKDSVSAITFINSLEHPYNPQHFAPELFRFMGTLPEEEALALSSLIKNFPSMRVSVIADVFHNQARQSPQSAMAWLESQEVTFAEELAYRAAEQGAFGDAEPTMKWLLSIDETPILEAVVTGVFENWLATDPDSATSYLNSLADVRIFDRAVSTYIEGAAEVDISAAMTWAEALDDEDLRTATVLHLQTDLRQAHVENCKNCNHFTSF